MRKAVVIIAITAIFVLGALFVLAFIQDRSNHTSKTLPVEGIDQVASAQFFPAHGGAGNTTLTLNMARSQDREMIDKVLTWIHTSKVVGSAINQSVGGSPNELLVKFQSGVEIRIIDAESIPDQVTLFYNNKAQRMNTPDLKAWIENGWSQEASFKFTETDAIAKVLRDHPEFPSDPNNKNTVYEQIGGPSNHQQPVTLTTKVEKDGLLSYIITLTKDYNLTINHKKAITYWKYRTDPDKVQLIDSQDQAPSIK